MQHPMRKHKRVLCATDRVVLVVRFRTWWRWWDTCYSMDTWQNKQTPKNSTGTGSQKSLMQCITESLAVGQICSFHRCQLIRGSQPLDHCWRNETKKRRRPGSINDTMHLVKQHPPLQTTNMYTLLSSHVHYFIHITVSSTLLLTYTTNHQHFHKEHLLEFI